MIDRTVFRKVRAVETAEGEGYVLEGAVKIGDTEVEKGEAALLAEGDSVKLYAAEPARLVVIAGKPHGEEIILSGSFVY